MIPYKYPKNWNFDKSQLNIILDREFDLCIGEYNKSHNKGIKMRVFKCEHRRIIYIGVINIENFKKNLVKRLTNALKLDKEKMVMRNIPEWFWNGCMKRYVPTTIQDKWRVDVERYLFGPREKCSIIFKLDQ